MNKRTHNLAIGFLLTFLLISSPIYSQITFQEKVDHLIISRIKEEGFQRSKVMETLSWLSDVYGPRFLGTPAYREAAEWAKNAMQEWGLQNVTLEPSDLKAHG